MRCEHTAELLGNVANGDGIMSVRMRTKKLSLRSSCDCANVQRKQPSTTVIAQGKVW